MYQTYNNEGKIRMGNEETRPGFIYIKAIDQWVAVKRWQIITYYYGVRIPQDINSDATAGLFETRGVDKDLTNFSRPFMFPAGHECLIYKVSLAVKPTEQARIVDVFMALQSGDLTIHLWDETPFICEPLSFFPVTIYGELAARENDILERVAISQMDREELYSDETAALIQAISGMATPAFVGESQKINGHVDLKKELYGTTPFTLYVLLHTVSMIPVV